VPLSQTTTFFGSAMVQLGSNFRLLLNAACGTWTRNVVKAIYK